MTITRSLLAYSSLFILIGLNSCNLQDEKIPSYLYIDKFTISAKQGEGSAHQNITDGWIYVNGNYYGGYELPVWIPLLEEGNSEVFILPGFRKDGRITNSFKYTFLNSYTTQLTLTPRITDTIRPMTSYQDGLIFSAIENFDHSNHFDIDRDNDADTKLTTTSSTEAFEGSGSGLIELTSAHPYISAENINDLIIPQSGDPIIIELSFKSDIPFSIGLRGYKEFREEHVLINGGVLPKKEWTKIYFDFRDIINNSNSDYYRLAISANFVADSTPAIQRILIDNIKVIHR